MKKKSLIILISITVIVALSLIILFLLNKKEENHYIIKNTSEYSQYENRGYYVEKTNNGKILVTIAQGMHNTGGYNISITKVKFIDGGVQIYVDETSPELYEIVTQAFTYPIAQVEFDKMPNYITIKSNNNFENFEKQTLTNNDN